MRVPAPVDPVHCSAEELQQALGPITSLLSKSEKAQQKLTPGTWQHSMLRSNIAALRLASTLIKGEPDQAICFAPDDMQKARDAISSMISRTAKSQERFVPGTSQHTLQRNRLKALRVAEALIRAELDKEKISARNEGNK